MLGAGVVINPTELISEISQLENFKIHIATHQLWLSARAQVITPWHIHLDCQREANSSHPSALLSVESALLTQIKPAALVYV